MQDLQVRLDRAAGGLANQLAAELRTAVRSGRLAAGGRLPATRELARDLETSRGVVVEAYQQLVAEGFLTSRQGSGTRVAPVAPPGAIAEAAAGAELRYGAAAGATTGAAAPGLAVLEGLIILVLVFTGFRTAVFHAIPAELKVAISVGIGLFIALIGFVDAGFVQRTGVGPVPVQLGATGQLSGWPVLVFGFGLLLVIALWALKVRGAILISIIVTTIVALVVEWIGDLGAAAVVGPGGWQLSVPAPPDDWIVSPDFGTLGEFSLIGSFEEAGVVTALLLVFTLLLADFFDTMGTMTAIGAEAGLLDEEGKPPNTERILVVDSLAAAAGGAAGVSSNTSYIESAAGVGEGARTGLASVVTGVLFLLVIPLTPLVRLIPSEAAVPALVLVGFLMMQQVTGIEWDDIEIAIPAFLTIVLMPFTYSITVGIGAGFIAYVFLKLVRGKVREVHPLLWFVAAAFVLYFAIDPITDWLT